MPGGDGRGDRESVGRCHPETVVVSNVGNVLGEASGIDVRIGAPDIAVRVTPLLLGGIGVGITVSHIAKLILSMELQKNQIETEIIGFYNARNLHNPPL